MWDQPVKRYKIEMDGLLAGGRSLQIGRQSIYFSAVHPCSGKTRRIETISARTVPSQKPPSRCSIRLGHSDGSAMVIVFW